MQIQSLRRVGGMGRGGGGAGTTPPSKPGTAVRGGLDSDLRFKGVLCVCWGEGTENFVSQKWPEETCLSVNSGCSRPSQRQGGSKEVA